MVERMAGPLHGGALLLRAGAEGEACSDRGGVLKGRGGAGSANNKIMERFKVVKQLGQGSFSKHRPPLYLSLLGLPLTAIRHHLRSLGPLPEGAEGGAEGVKGRQVEEGATIRVLGAFEYSA